MKIIRKTMNSVDEATNDLKRLGYRLRIKNERGILTGRVLQKPAHGKAVDLEISDRLTPAQRDEHPELCEWLDHNAIAKGPSLVIFNAARIEVPPVGTPDL